MKSVLDFVSPSLRNAARALAVVLLTLPLPSFATVITYTTADSPFDSFALNQGWWSSSGPSQNDNDAYSTGELAGGSFRGFFTFDLHTLIGTVTGATLRVMRGVGSTSFEDVQLLLWDVATPADVLNHNEGLNPAIVADLGSGNNYGSFLVPKASEPSWSQSSYMEYLLLPLNNNAVVEINSATGFFSIGAMTGAVGQSIFGGTRSGGYGADMILRDPLTTTYLDLTIQPPVSVTEPATNVLLGLGILFLVITRRRKYTF
jgi:hypothetical protein